MDAIHSVKLVDDSIADTVVTVDLKDSAFCPILIEQNGGEVALDQEAWSHVADFINAHLTKADGTTDWGADECGAQNPKVGHRRCIVRPHPADVSHCDYDGNRWSSPPPA